MDYSDEQRQAALDCLAANDGDYGATAEATGVTVKTLRRWAQQASEVSPKKALHDLRDEFMTLKRTLEADPAPDDAGADLHHWLRTKLTPKLLDGSVHLLDSLADGIDDAPLNQRIAALKYCTDTLLKLLEIMPRGKERLVRVEFVDPDDGTPHPTPYWTRDDSAE